MLRRSNDAHLLCDNSRGEGGGRRAALLYVTNNVQQVPTMRTATVSVREACGAGLREKLSGNERQRQPQSVAIWRYSERLFSEHGANLTGIPE